MSSPYDPTPYYGHHLNLTMQTIATVVLWTGTAGTLAWAGVLARRTRTVLPVCLVLAVAAGSLLEPVYDLLYHLLWYTGGPHGADITGDQWTLFTAFDLPQPVWVMPAYVMVFGLPALLTYRSFAAGTSLGKVFRMAALLACTTAAFETIATNVDLYGYYSQAPWRFLKYPLWIAFMEAAQITGYAVLCAVLLRRKTSEWQCLALFAVFPANFGFDVIGAGFPTLVAQNAADVSSVLLELSAFVSVAFAATCLWWTSQLLLHDQRHQKQAATAASWTPAVTGAPVPVGR
jgi:hypothetical protein